MALTRVQKTILGGDPLLPISGASCGIFKSGVLAQIYSDSGGTTLISNPYTTGSDGLLAFYVEPSKLDLNVSHVSGAQSHPNFLAISDTVIVGPRPNAEFADIANMKTATTTSGITIEWSDYLGRDVRVIENNSTTGDGGNYFTVVNSNPGKISVLDSGIWKGVNHDLGGGFYAKNSSESELTPVKVGANSEPKVIKFDSVSSMNAAPSDLFGLGDTVELSSYYAGWAATVDGPYPFKGTIVSDADMLNIRGSAADGFGDFDMGDDKNFLVDTSRGFINKIWGCRPNQDIDDTSRLQALFAAPKAGSNATFIFAGGAQQIESSSQLEIASLGKVVIKGEGSSLKLKNGTTTIYGLTIRDCERVHWKSLDVNLNETIYKGAVRIQDIRYQVKLFDSDFYNFATDDTLGFECAQQMGFDIDSINKNPANISNNSSPGLQVVNCSFFNEATILDTSFDYDDNYCGGTGIRLNNNAEYWRVTNCGFFGLCIGMWIESGNGSIVNCEFQEILGVAQKSYIALAIPEGGGVYLPSAGDNNGKLNVTGCKFNHNWGFSVRSAYISNNRPVCIDNNQFIANSFTAVNITGTKRSRITNNYFERAHNYLALPSWPWAAFNSGRVCFIQLASGSNHCTVMGNDGKDLPLGTLVENLAGGGILDVKVTNNTLASDVTGSPSPWFTATPTINRNNDILG